jgi:uncharacterized damage-inducible protein DinB
MLASFLDWLRGSIVRKCEGLSEEDARRPMVPSGTSLLGMIKHLGYVERWWFQYHFGGRSDVYLPEGDDDFRVEPTDTVRDVVDFYNNECEASREIVAAAPSCDEHARSRERSEYTLRWILIHMIEETARHAGHADILRELIDGATGE